MASAPPVHSECESGSSRALVVLGMHRSGTSAMTRTLSLLGAALPKDVMQARSDNPIGFWEPQKVADLNDEILHALDSDWDDVFAFRPKPYLSNFDGVFVGRAVELLQEQFDGSELIAFKDPRVSVLTAFWDRVLRKAGYAPSYIIMLRNPLEVTESLRKRNSFPREKSLLLWSSYMMAAERDTRSLSRTFVSYDDLMRDWRAVRQRIEAMACAPFPRETATAAIEIDRFLDRGMRNYVTTAEELFSRADVPDHVKALYRLFLEASQGAALDEGAVDAIRSELTNIETLVGPLIADLRMRTRTLEREVAQERDAQLTAVGRADRLAEELTAERSLSLSQTEAATQFRAEHERELAELSIRLAETQAALEIEQTAGAQLRAEQEGELGKLSLRLAETQAALENEQTAGAESRSALTRARLEIDEVRVQKRNAEDRLTILSKELNRKQAAVAEAKKQYADKVAEMNDALDLSRTETRAVEAKLSHRLGELASVTKLLADSEARERQALDEAEWLRDASSVLLNGLSNTEGWLSRLLPAFIHARRQRRLLRRKGLFDDEAYLTVNADVANEGVDPLRHYLDHGILEKRRRI